jgi:hypothetical protein
MTNEKSLLDPGEQLIWSGKPKPVWFAMRMASRPLLAGIGFLVLFVIYSSDVNRGISQIDPKIVQVTIVARIVFAIIAGVLSSISVIAALWMWLRAHRTTYQLTNRRAVIDTRGPIPRRISIPLEHLRFVELRSRFFGPSDLIFSETRGFSPDGWGPRGQGFIAITDANQVESLVRTAIDQTFVTRTRGPWQ